MIKPDEIDNTWTLFLDRDGVINKRLIDDYVKTVDEFVFIDGVLDSLKLFKNLFGRIIVVTNQRGIALGLMSNDDLSVIHEFMLDRVGRIGGRIDRIYHCPHDKGDNCDCRKPKPGMLMKAYDDFPEIDFKKSIMVGDSDSDMQMGRSRSLINIYISETGERINSADMVFPSLIDFGRYLVDDKF